MHFARFRNKLFIIIIFTATDQTQKYNKQLKHVLSERKPHVPMLFICIQFSDLMIDGKKHILFML